MKKKTFIIVYIILVLISHVYVTSHGFKDIFDFPLSQYFNKLIIMQIVGVGIFLFLINLAIPYYTSVFKNGKKQEKWLLIVVIIILILMKATEYIARVR